MRRGSLIWGVMIILAGILFLLGNLGLLPVNAWQLIWPVVLIVLGLWFLLGPRYFSKRNMETKELIIPIEGIRQAEVQLNHGAGRLDVSGGALSGQLLAGSFGGGVDYDVDNTGQGTRVKLTAPADIFFPGTWMGSSEGYRWHVSFNPEVSLNLIFKTGASESLIDLSGLQVHDVRIETGASSTELILPKNAGNTRVDIHAGAASVDVRVPDQVACRIHVQTGLSGIEIDRNRFAITGNNNYQSADYDTAANRADINIETGVGSIKIR